jgi:hypothetical protein
MKKKIQKIFLVQILSYFLKMNKIFSITLLVVVLAMVSLNFLKAHKQLRFGHKNVGSPFVKLSHALKVKRDSWGADEAEFFARLQEGNEEDAKFMEKFIQSEQEYDKLISEFIFELETQLNEAENRFFQCNNELEKFKEVQLTSNETVSP